MKTHYLPPTTHYQGKRGMTALEIMIAVVIVMIVGTLIMVPFSRFKSDQLLVSSSEQVISALREARANTLAAKNDTVHGVHFESGRFVTFDTAWSEGAEGNVVTPFQSPVTLSGINLVGGASDVVFARLSGKTNQTGTLVLQLNGDASRQKIIIINAAGTISINE